MSDEKKVVVVDVMSIEIEKEKVICAT